MNAFSIVLLVLFVLVMALWALSLLGAVAVATTWMAFFACLFLGIAVFVKPMGH